MNEIITSENAEATLPPASTEIAYSTGTTAATPNGFGAKPSWKRPREAVTLADGRVVIGRVGAPPRQEATSSRFHFWIPEDALVEATQIITAESTLAGKNVQFYGLVEEVHRCSRRRDMGQEVDEFDGALDDEPDFEAEGITYADVAILRADPALLTPPRERSRVFLAGPKDAWKAYGTDQIIEEKRLPIGLIKNGGDATAGQACLDLDYLLGANGGHLNVSGAAGRATKSSFLLSVVYCLHAHALRLAVRDANSPYRPRPVPIIFNVKNYDLFYLDFPSKRYNATEHGAAWAEVGIPEPTPFRDAVFYAAQQANSDSPLATGRPGTVRAYSWGLKDVIERGLLSFLFSDEDAANDNFAAMLLDIEELLTNTRIEDNGTEKRTLRTTPVVTDGPVIRTFTDLRDWLRAGGSGLSPEHVAATRRKLLRRLLKLMAEGRGVLRLDTPGGKPLDVVRNDTTPPQIIDLNGLAGLPSLQRFVVAAVLKQVVEARTGNRQQPGLRYLIVLDELNRFAPRNAKDPITQLIETVAAEMRSQGVLLFGAQQQASLVSARVIENAAVKALGQTGSLELSSDAWRSLSEATRRRVEALRLDGKLVLQSGFRQPMHLRVPFPAWAMNREEADFGAGPSANGPDGAPPLDMADFGEI
jgi:uncharacterized protein